ncbi:MAG: hypothetical protein JWO07_123 [Candidatus Saccharibacteria bacterium]|nr:hypothetical protein [Candidatus Saccharibacteria bacterium]
MSKNQPTSGENAWYYIVNIFTLGSLYFAKIVIKRAIQEANKDDK